MTHATYAGGFKTEKPLTLEISTDDQGVKKDWIQFFYNLRFHKQGSPSRVNNMVEQYIQEKAAVEKTKNKDIIKKAMVNQMTEMQSSKAYINDSLGIIAVISTKYAAVIEEVIKAEKKSKRN